MSSWDSPACSPAGIITRPTRRTAACRRTSSRRRITPIPWCWCRRIMNSAQNCCSTMSCCRPRGAIRAIRLHQLTTLIARRIWKQALDSIFNNQNVGAVHLPPAHPASRHQQSQPRLCLSRRAGFQRQRHRRARRHAGRGQGDPARLRSAQHEPDLTADLTASNANRSCASPRWPARFPRRPTSAAPTARAARKPSDHHHHSSAASHEQRRHRSF